MQYFSCYVLFSELISSLQNSECNAATAVVESTTVVRIMKGSRKQEGVVAMERVWGIRTGRAAEILNKLKQHMREHPDNFYGDVDTLLELIYFHYTEYNPVETPEFKAVINPLEKTLRSLVETDEEADKYMNIVFELCCAYERQAYVEGIKLGARLTMELLELPLHQ